MKRDINQDDPILDITEAVVVVENNPFLKQYTENTPGVPFTNTV